MRFASSIVRGRLDTSLIAGSLLALGATTATTTATTATALAALARCRIAFGGHCGIVTIRLDRHVRTKKLRNIRGFRDHVTEILVGVRQHLAVDLALGRTLDLALTLGTIATATPATAATTARTAVVVARTLGALGTLAWLADGLGLVLFLDRVLDLFLFLLDEIFLDFLDRCVETRRVGGRRSGDLDRHARAFLLAVGRDFDHHAVTLFDLSQFATLAVEQVERRLLARAEQKLRPTTLRGFVLEQTQRRQPRRRSGADKARALAMRARPR